MYSLLVLFWRYIAQWKGHKLILDKDYALDSYTDWFTNINMGVVWQNLLLVHMADLYVVCKKIF